MELRETFPFWDQLSASQQALITQRAVLREVPRGSGALRRRDGLCGIAGIALRPPAGVCALTRWSGGDALPAHSREICLFPHPVCWEPPRWISPWKPSRTARYGWIPPDVFRQIAHESAAAAGYVNTLMARRFSEVMWLVEQVMWQSMDRRLAAFLLEESALEHTDTLRLTHEQIANHLGTAREVVTRMLRYFQSEGMVRLSRGTVAIADRRRLEALRPSTV